MRLIDADVFVEDLGTEALNLAMDGLKGTPRPRQHLYEIIDRINEQPTAYDIDKVVEELQSEVERWEDGGKEYGDKCEIAVARGLRNAIEIVKQGSVSDDVCEWKYSGNVFISCNYKRFTDLHSFEYCPYCGKKIKVVE